MKNVLIAMLTIASFGAMAQDGHRHGPRESKDPLTPEQFSTLHTKRMTLALDLTQVQQEQVQKFHLEKARLRKEKMESRKEERMDQAKKELSAEERFLKQSERLDRMIEEKDEMKKILNEEQYGKWEDVMRHRKHRGQKDGKKIPRRS